MVTEKRTVHLTHEIQNRDRYVRVPFDVPTGLSSLEVAIAYDQTIAVIDLGCEGAAGWRGWSGGARTRYVIATDDATPGYLPGTPEPGEWSVILGVHRLPAEGIDVSVEISLPATSTIDHGPIASPVTDVRRGSTRDLPAPDGLRWFAGDFHAHTIHSDGAESISQLAALGARAGLDFLAVTDHNTTSHHRLLAAAGEPHGITLLPGQEVTTHRGHANVFGDVGFIDFRKPAQEWADEARRRGGVMSVNHPISGDCSWLHRFERVPQAIELWHSTWFLELISTAPLAYFTRWDQSVTLLGGADFHKRTDGIGPGTPTTWVAATDSSVDAILEGVAAGRTSIMGGVTERDGLTTPDLFTAPMLVRVGDELIADHADGLIFVDGSGRRTVVHGERVSFTPDGASGPFALLHPDRQIAALSA